jgi:hypothetical protein
MDKKTTLDNLIDLLVGGKLTNQEKEFVALTKSKWDHRIIINSLRRRRGMVPVPTNFIWPRDKYFRPADSSGTSIKHIT